MHSTTQSKIPVHKVFSQTHWAALISVYLVFSQTPAYTAKPCLLSSLLFKSQLLLRYSSHLPTEV